jgi:hypothetical protein
LGHIPGTFTAITSRIYGITIIIRKIITPVLMKAASGSVFK